MNQEIKIAGETLTAEYEEIKYQNLSQNGFYEIEDLFTEGMQLINAFNVDNTKYTNTNIIKKVPEYVYSDLLETEGTIKFLLSTIADNPQASPYAVDHAFLSLVQAPTETEKVAFLITNDDEDILTARNILILGEHVELSTAEYVFNNPKLRPDYAGILVRLENGEELKDIEKEY